MKKILLIFILLMTSISFLFSSEDTTPTGMQESVRLSVTTTNTVYLGVSSQKVVSSVFPSSSIISEEKFYYDPKALLWYSPSLFFFVISFVDLPLTISITVPSKLAPITDGVTDSLLWKPSGDITIPTNTNGFATGLTDKVLKTESSTETGLPRIYCWEVKMAIPGETVIEGQYKGTFALKVTSCS